MVKTYIIAEMSANHAGDLSHALEIVHAAKESGADCLKVQTYTPDTITLKAATASFILKSGTWAGYNLYQLYEEAHTPWDWQGRIKEETEKVGIDFLSTPFDATAVDFLEELGVSAYKIASFEIVDIPLLRYVAQKGKPIILSTGMAAADEIQEAVATIVGAGNDRITLLKCSSTYPAVYEQMNLATIPDLKNRFGYPVGLSDHSMGYLAAVVAVSLGASVIEKHFCLSRDLKNPDASFSMEPKEFLEMAVQVRHVEKALGRPFYGVTEQEKDSVCFRRSIFTAGEIKKGEVFTAENIRVVRPADGLHPRYYDSIIGKRAACDIDFAVPLTMDMVEVEG